MQRLWRGCSNRSSIDIVFLPMAVADFEPEPRPGKIGSEADVLNLQCRRTPKVIRSVRDWSPGSYLVGFKLLSRASREELLARGAAACHDNRTDLTVANDLQTLRQDQHTIYLVRPNHDPETLAPGVDLAERLVARVWAWSEDVRARRALPSPAADERA